MDAPSLYVLASVLQPDLISAVEKVIPRSSWRVPLPWCFGSRKYGLAGPSSDVGFLVVAPDAIAVERNDIRACLASILRGKGVKCNGLRDVKDLGTLKWSLPAKPLSQLRVAIFLRD